MLEKNKEEEEAALATGLAEQQSCKSKNYLSQAHNIAEYVYSKGEALLRDRILKFKDKTR